MRFNLCICSWSVAWTEEGGRLRYGTDLVSTVNGKWASSADVSLDPSNAHKLNADILAEWDSFILYSNQNHCPKSIQEESQRGEHK
jgi:hypothetical protein